MGNISKDLFKDWNDGDLVTAEYYVNERELLRVAINDNWERLIKRYRIMHEDGSTKSIQDLGTVINTFNLQDTDTIHVSLDASTSTITFRLIDGVLDRRYYTKAEIDDNYYTKPEVDAGNRGQTIIKYEVYTIVSSDNGNGTFTYRDRNNNEYVGEINENGWQVFDLKLGTYPTHENKINALINDTLHRSEASGGLADLSSTSVALTYPESNGVEITFMYYEQVGLMGEHAISHTSVGSDPIPTLPHIGKTAPTNSVTLVWANTN